MTDIVYTSQVRVERLKGPLRQAYLPGKTEPVFFGYHSEFAEYTDIDMAQHEPHPTTLDYVVAAATG